MSIEQRARQQLAEAESAYHHHFETALQCDGDERESHLDSAGDCMIAVDVLRDLLRPVDEAPASASQDYAGNGEAEPNLTEAELAAERHDAENPPRGQRGSGQPESRYSVGAGSRRGELYAWEDDEPVVIGKFWSARHAQIFCEAMEAHDIKTAEQHRMAREEYARGDAVDVASLVHQKPCPVGNVEPVRVTVRTAVKLCDHAGMQFYAATGAEPCSSGNATAGVHAKCKACGQSWAGDVRFGVMDVLSHPEKFSPVMNGQPIFRRQRPITFDSLKSACEAALNRCHPSLTVSADLVAEHMAATLGIGIPGLCGDAPCPAETCCNPSCEAPTFETVLATIRAGLDHAGYTMGPSLVRSIAIGAAKHLCIPFPAEVNPAPPGPPNPPKGAKPREVG